LYSQDLAELDIVQTVLDTAVLDYYESQVLKPYQTFDCGFGSYHLFIDPSILVDEQLMELFQSLAGDLIYCRIQTAVIHTIWK